MVHGEFSWPSVTVNYVRSICTVSKWKSIELLVYRRHERHLYAFWQALAISSSAACVCVFLVCTRGQKHEIMIERKEEKNTFEFILLGKSSKTLRLFLLIPWTVSFGVCVVLIVFYMMRVARFIYIYIVYFTTKKTQKRIQSTDT